MPHGQPVLEFHMFSCSRPISEVCPGQLRVAKKIRGTAWKFQNKDLLALHDKEASPCRAARRTEEGAQAGRTEEGAQAGRTEVKES